MPVKPFSAVMMESSSRTAPPRPASMPPAAQLPASGLRAPGRGGSPQHAPAAGASGAAGGPDPVVELLVPAVDGLYAEYAAALPVTDEVASGGAHGVSWVSCSVSVDDSSQIGR